jgi:hypothetical protein
MAPCGRKQTVATGFVAIIDASGRLEFSVSVTDLMRGRNRLIAVVAR